MANKVLVTDRTKIQTQKMRGRVRRKLQRKKRVQTYQRGSTEFVRRLKQTERIS